MLGLKNYDFCSSDVVLLEKRYQNEDVHMKEDDTSMIRPNRQKYLLSVLSSSWKILYVRLLLFLNKYIKNAPVCGAAICSFCVGLADSRILLQVWKRHPGKMHEYSISLKASGLILMWMILQKVSTFMSQIWFNWKLIKYKIIFLIMC